jgi:hypothetical protein
MAYLYINCIKRILLITEDHPRIGGKRVKHRINID